MGKEKNSTVVSILAFAFHVILYSCLVIKIGKSSFYLNKEDRKNDFLTLQGSQLLSAVVVILSCLPSKAVPVFSTIFRPLMGFKFLFSSFGAFYSPLISSAILIIISYFPYKLGQKWRGASIAKEELKVLKKTNTNK